MPDSKKMAERWEDGTRKQYEAYIRIVDFALSEGETEAECSLTKADAKSVVAMVDECHQMIEDRAKKVRELSAALLYVLASKPIKVGSV